MDQRHKVVGIQWWKNRLEPEQAIAAPYLRRDRDRPQRTADGAVIFSYLFVNQRVDPANRTSEHKTGDNRAGDIGRVFDTQVPRGIRRNPENRAFGKRGHCPRAIPHLNPNRSRVKGWNRRQGDSLDPHPDQARLAR